MHRSQRTGRLLRYSPCSTGNTHIGSGYGSSPCDIIVGSAANVHFYGTVGIGSIYITARNTCASTSDTSNPGLSTDMYTGPSSSPGTYIGSVFYGHATPLLTGWQDTTVYGLATVYNIATLAPVSGGCSNAYHVHMERSGNAITSEIQCPDQAVIAASWIYRWPV